MNVENGSVKRRLTLLITAVGMIEIISTENYYTAGE